MAADPTLAIEALTSPGVIKPRPWPVWVGLAAPYALFLLVLLVVPFVNVALYSIHPYSPTKVSLPGLTVDNYA
jgi:hypothetical protein